MPRDRYATRATGEKMAHHGAAFGGGELTAQQAFQKRGVRMAKGTPFDMRGGCRGVF
jgi:hypothetical protein